MKESDNGAQLSVGSIVDANNSVWTLVNGNGLEVYKDNAPAGYTANVALLLYWGHQVYQSNQAGGWWVWNGSSWADSVDPRPPGPTPIPTPTPPTPTPTPTPPTPPTPTPTPSGESANGTQVTSTNGSITDSKQIVWTLVQTTTSGLRIARNGVVDATTANVALMLYWAHQVYQSNQAGGWWMWTGGGWTNSSDPRLPAGNSVMVDLKTQTGVTVSPMLWGLGSSGDMASNKFATTNDAKWQAQAKSLNMKLYRPNFGNSGLMKMIFANQSPDWSYIDTLLNNLPKFVDLNACRILTTIGGHGPPPWCNIWSSQGQDQYADCCVQVAQRFESKGIHCDWWEMWNEPDGDGFDINTYVALFQRFEQKMRAYAASIGRTYHLGGCTDTWMQSDRIKKLCQNCKPDFLSYHQYSTGPGDGNYQPGNLYDTATVMQKAISTFGQTAGDCRNAAAGTASASMPIFLGEWNIVYTPDSGGGNYNIDRRQVTNIGAVFAALATTSIINANKNCPMGALWELFADTYYGVIRPDSSYSLSAQGVLYKKLATTMSGAQVKTSIGGSMNLKALAAVDGSKYCVMLMNYDENKSYAVNVTGLSGTVNYLEISGSYMGGTSRSFGAEALNNLNVPAMSVVILNN